MSMERALERLDHRVWATRKALEVAYAARVPDERKDTLLARLDALEAERELLRRRWSLSVAFDGLGAEIARVWRRLIERIKPLLADLGRFDEERKRSRPAFWRENVRGSVTANAFAYPLPMNWRPVLPGFMKQKGRG